MTASSPSPSISPSVLSPEHTMDAFAQSMQQRLDNQSAFIQPRRVAVRSARETSKAFVAQASTGPLQKGSNSPPDFLQGNRELIKAQRLGLACLSCKARRVKCDGLKPSCSSCVRNARWEGRCPETDHGCVYRADLPQTPATTYATHPATLGLVKLATEAREVTPKQEQDATPGEFCATRRFDGN